MGVRSYKVLLRSTVRIGNSDIDEFNSKRAIRTGSEQRSRLSLFCMDSGHH